MKKIHKILFIISFIPIAFTIIYSIYHAIVGIDTGIVCYQAPCPSYLRGIKALKYSFIMTFTYSVPTYVVCLIYQLVYIFKLRKTK